MTYQSLISCVLMVLFSMGAMAQSGVLEGQIVLKDTYIPLDGIHIYLDNTTLGSYTDRNGAFFLSEIPPGDYDLVASAIGYATLQVPVKMNGETLMLPPLEMEETVMGLPQAVVQSVSLTGGLRGLRDVPGSAHFLPAQELQKFNYTDVTRILRAVPGVNLQEEDGFGLRPNIGLRGAGTERSSKITLMEDGILAAPAPYSAPAAYYFPTIGRMQAVEILKGSSQVRFGPYTTGGAINLISTAIPEDFSGRIDLSAGSFGSMNLHAFAGNSHRHFDYLIETFQYHSNGFKDLDGGGDTGFDKKDYMLKLRLHTGPGAKVAQSLLLKAGQMDENSNETYLGLTDADFAQTPNRRYAASQKDKMDADQQQYSLRHIVQLSRAVDITTTAYLQYVNRNWYKLDKVKILDDDKAKISTILANTEQHQEHYGILTGQTSPIDDALFVKANNRMYKTQGVQTVAGFRFGKGLVKHVLDIGLRYHYDEMDRFQWVDVYRMEEEIMERTHTGTPGTESNRIQSANAFATYTQYKLKIGRWTFIPGLRFEDLYLRRMDYGKDDPAREGGGLKESRNHIQVWIPGVGMDFHVNESTHFFGGVHKGFSPPGATEGADPEQSINYELGSRVSYPGFSGQAVLFYNHYSNLLGSDMAAAGGSGTGDLFNGGMARVMGLELQGRYDLLFRHRSEWNLPVGIAYTYTDATFQSNFDSDFEAWGTVVVEDELPYLAKHQLTLMLAVEGKRWGIDVNSRIQSAMRSRAGQGVIPASEKADAFFLVDLAGYFQLHRSFSLFSSVSNLFDTTYVVARHPAGLRPTMPRNVRIGGKVNF